MKVKALQYLMLAFVLSDLLISQVDCQVLPQAICSNCAGLFGISGCFDEESFLCRLLAFKLTFGFGENFPLCIEYPCEGYGQTTGYQCTGLLGCSLASVDPNGLCPTGQRCCTNPPSPSP